MVLMAFLATPAFAAGTETNFDSITNPIVDLINSLLTPTLAIVGAIGSLYCVVLGVNYAKAEEPQDREKAKGHLKSAIIGFVLIFVLMLALKLAMPILQNWVAANS
jgi:phosphotransferase system  glucose/maltose/N-acetylglucosamine-specific IIC component